MLSADSPELAGSYNNLGLLYQNQGNLAKAEELRPMILPVVEKATAALEALDNNTTD